MSTPCPPAPNYVRARGVTDCQSLQMGPSHQQRLFNQHNAESGQFKNLLSNNPEGYYMVVGGLDMLKGYAPTPPRVYGRSLGRSVLPMNTAQRWNRDTGIQPTHLGLYDGIGGTSSPEFIKDLWTAQALTYWLTDGMAYADYGQIGMVSGAGFNPRDPSPLQIIDSSGNVVYALEDLRNLLNPTGNVDVHFVKGPDGLFGPSAESLLAEYVRSGTIMGQPLPSTGEDAVFARLTAPGRGISTPKIEAARDERDAAKAAGQVVVPETTPTPTPCNQLTPQARAARSDCSVPTSDRDVILEDERDKVAPPKEDKPKGDAKYTSNTGQSYLVLGLGLVAAGVTFAVYKKRQRKLGL